LVQAETGAEIVLFLELKLTLGASAIQTSGRGLVCCALTEFRGELGTLNIALLPGYLLFYEALIDTA
jgi:hypothetical protein